MKRTILYLAALVAVGGAAFHFLSEPRKHDAAPVPSAMTQTTDPPDPAVVAPPVNSSRPPAEQKPRAESQSKSVASNRADSVASPTSTDAIAFAAAIDTLISPHSTYDEKQAAWKQLKESGRLADAAAELEQRIQNAPAYTQLSDSEKATYQAALGQAYLKMCATTTDVRSQAIWAMAADKDFENALTMDPSNWDARFTKTVAMTYWPPALNKGNDVIQQFNMLIAQQEQQSPQAQFAQTYEWLGKQYQKAGQLDAAQSVWQRGVALYPGDSSLQNLLATSSAPQP